MGVLGIYAVETSVGVLCIYAVETIVGVLGMYAVETTGNALKIQFVVFWGTEMKKLHDFPYLVNHRSYRPKLLDPSK